MLNYSIVLFHDNMLILKHPDKRYLFFAMLVLINKNLAH